MDGGDIFCLSVLSGTVQVPCHARAAEFLTHYNRYFQNAQVKFWCNKLAVKPSILHSALNIVAMALRALPVLPGPVHPWGLPHVAHDTEPSVRLQYCQFLSQWCHNGGSHQMPGCTHLQAVSQTQPWAVPLLREVPNTLCYSRLLSLGLILTCLPGLSSDLINMASPGDLGSWVNPSAIFRPTLPPCQDSGTGT